MTGEPESSPGESKQISLYKGQTNVTLTTEREPLDLVRKDVADAMNSKNLAFLLGSGCSSSVDEEGKERGIPTMAPMARDFLAAGDAEPKVTAEDQQTLLNVLGIDLAGAEFAGNLERLMEVLYGYDFVLVGSKRQELAEAAPAVERVIESVKQYVFGLCAQSDDGDPDQTVLKTYERFYRRLSQRERTLPRPWVFTTNYDLFNERAMDRLGVPYINGFQGSVERRFNPASFRYTLAEQLDISSRKWSSLDSLVYFAKLHGSVSWRAEDDGLFPVTESAPGTPEFDRMLIYPTPAKQNASFAAPYSDMFRELQSRVAREQTALITLGYGFGDEHVNNIIFQALTIPTFRLVAFVSPKGNEMVETLLSLDDPRIWIVGTEEGDGPWKAHYFANFVDEIMPTTTHDPADDAVERVLTRLIRHTPAVAPQPNGDDG